MLDRGSKETSVVDIACDCFQSRCIITQVYDVATDIKMVGSEASMRLADILRASFRAGSGMMAFISSCLNEHRRFIGDTVSSILLRGRQLVGSSFLGFEAGGQGVH